MKILVTGASGFVGGHLAASIASSGHVVIACGGKNPCSPAVEQVVCRVEQLDLRNVNAIGDLFARNKPEVVVHAAALARANDCEKNPDDAFSHNVLISEELAKEAAQIGAGVIHISTDLVFDGSAAPAGGYCEKDPVAPASVYAKTKAQAEERVLENCPNSAICRICLVYGPPIGGHGGFLDWLFDGLRTGAKLSMYTDQWRTPIYIDDICEAVFKLCEQISSGPLKLDERIFHLAGPQRISRYDFAIELADAFGYSQDPIQAASLHEHSNGVPRGEDVSLSCAKFQQLLERAPIGISEGLSRLHQSMTG